MFSSISALSFHDMQLMQKQITKCLDEATLERLGLNMRRKFIEKTIHLFREEKLYKENESHPIEYFLLGNDAALFKDTDKERLLQKAIADDVTQDEEEMFFIDRIEKTKVRISIEANAWANIVKGRLEKNNEELMKEYETEEHEKEKERIHAEENFKKKKYMERKRRKIEESKTNTVELFFKKSCIIQKRNIGYTEARVFWLLYKVWTNDNNDRDYPMKVLDYPSFIKYIEYYYPGNIVNEPDKTVGRKRRNFVQKRIVGIIPHDLATGFHFLSQSKSWHGNLEDADCSQNSRALIHLAGLTQKITEAEKKLAKLEDRLSYDFEREE